ncbi:MAG TPA: hypothetical protein PLD54_01410, partial [Candidatus Levybacteria bacterium]|nr:hypothetical protein [Candidatus Levybacteria bacterium]
MVQEKSKFCRGLNLNTQSTEWSTKQNSQGIFTTYIQYKYGIIAVYMIDRENRYFQDEHISVAEEQIFDELMNVPQDAVSEITLFKTNSDAQDDRPMIEQSARDILRKKVYGKMPDIPLPIEFGAMDPFRIRTGQELLDAQAAEKRRAL